jgi:hypothetical protein
MIALLACSPRFRVIATLLLALALTIKILVPQGMMVDTSSKHITVRICTGMTAAQQTIEIAFDKASTNDHSSSNTDDTRCIFSGLSSPAIFGDIAHLLGAALAFIIAVGFAPIKRSVRPSRSYFRPPLRGPPSFS